MEQKKKLLVKKHRLQGVRLKEISLVDRPAIAVPFLLVKRDEDDPDPLLILTLVDQALNIMKRFNPTEYLHWCDFPQDYDYVFEPDEQNPESCIVRRKRGTLRMKEG